jgi:shikimate dehydrogenase
MLIDQYGVLGNPVAHSQSPWIHARFAELTGQRLHYDKQLVALDAFAQGLQTLQAKGYAGCNVTVPFKLQAASLAHQSSERVRLAQAANTLSFVNGKIHADNTDGLGLVRDITVNAGVPLAGRSVLLLGAGGAAAGALGELLRAQPARVVVANRTLSKAQQLVAQHSELATLQKTELLAHILCRPQADSLQNFDVLINATASSLGGDVPPLPAGVLRRGALAYDMMYGSAAAAFMQWANAQGAQARDGLGMLVEQAAQAFYIWRGLRPDSQRVLAELRARLAQTA